MNETFRCKCAYCFESPKGQLIIPKIASDIFLSPPVTGWGDAPKVQTSSPEKLVSIQEDVMRLLQWQVISGVFKKVHAKLRNVDCDVSVSSIVSLSPNIINNLFPKLTEDLLPTNFVHQAFRSITSCLNVPNCTTVTHLLANLSVHPLVEFLTFGPCCITTNEINLKGFFPAAASDFQLFLKLMHYVIDNICHKRHTAIYASTELEEYLMEESDEQLGTLTIYKQDKKDCITGYCSISKEHIFRRLKNQKERIKPYTNPTTFTIIFKNESIVIMTTLEIILEILHENTLHTPIEFIISADNYENQTFSNNFLYKGVNRQAFKVGMKKQAPTWCKHYVNYVTCSVSLLANLLGNLKIGSANNA